MLKPYLLLQYENKILKYTNELGGIAVTSIQYMYADRRDYKIMLKLSNLKALTPKQKMIAMEIMK